MLIEDNICRLDDWRTCDYRMNCEFKCHDKLCLMTQRLLQMITTYQRKPLFRQPEEKRDVQNLLSLLYRSLLPLPRDLIEVLEDLVHKQGESESANFWPQILECFFL